METALIALASALFFSLGNVIARVGLKKHPSPFSSTVMFAAGALVMWLLVLIGRFALPSPESLPWFALRGILDPGIAAILIFIAMRKLGIALTIPIVAASTIFSTTMSVFFLGENLTFFVVAGTLLIVGGVSLLSLNHSSVKGNRKYIWIAIAGSIFIGGSNVATKAALNISNTPVSGVAFSFAVGLALHLVFLAFTGRWKELPLSFSSARTFLLAGVFIAIAFIASFFALSTGMVSTVYPLISTQPLFTMFLSYVLLKKDEIITRNVVIGTVMVVAGAAILTVF